MKQPAHCILFAVLWLFICTATLAQRTVSGTVKGDDGELLGGVSVQVKDTNVSTATDTTGKFTLKVPSGKTVLLFRYVGYDPKELTLGKSNRLEVVLSTTNSLDEVVITALNIPRSQKSIPYSVQTVSGDELNPMGSNISLAGKIAGLVVFGRSDMKLNTTEGLYARGVGTLSGAPSPLIVVDGTPVTNFTLTSLDPANVESVTLLKGPNAAALYGQRGDAGVLLINLKRAAPSEGLGIEFHHSTLFDKVATLPKYQNLYAGGGVSELIKFTWQDGMPEDWKALDGKYYHNYSDDTSWGPLMEGQEYIPWYAWYPGTKYSFKTASLTPQPDNVRDFYGTGVRTNTSFAFTKATDLLLSRFSFAYQDETGLIPQTTNRKYILSTNTTINLSKKLAFDLNLTYSPTTNTGEYADYYNNQTTGSFSAWFHRDLDMKIVRELKDLHSPEGILASWNHSDPGAYLTGPANFYAGNRWFNFYSYFDHHSQVRNYTRLFGDLGLTYKINPKLKIAGFLRQNRSTYDGDYKVDYILEKSIIQFGYRNYYGVANQTFREQNYEVLASYSDKLGPVSIEANLGGNIRNENQLNLDAYTSQGMIIPDLFRLDNSLVTVPAENHIYNKIVRSVYARGSFGWKDMLFADWSVRNDWSSALPPGSNSYRYPSVGMSFIFSELIKKNNILSYGKLRGSWAQVGDDLGAYALNPPYGFYNQWGSNLASSAPNVVVDPAIKAALSSSYETGLDLKLLKNRVGINVTYYTESRTNEILTISVAGASGTTAKLINAGRLDRSGLELQLDLTPVKTSAFNWEITLNYATMHNKIVELAEGIDTQVLGNFSTISQVNAVGGGWGQIRGAGIKKINGLPVLTEDGYYISEPNQYFGSVLPDFNGGMFNTIRYKGFSLLFNIDFSKGGRYGSLSQAVGEYSGLLDQTAAINDKGKNVRDPVSEGGGVKVSGVDESGNPKEIYVNAYGYYRQFANTSIAEPYLYDYSFVKFRELSLSYELPVNKWGIGRVIRAAKVALLVKNPWLIYSAVPDKDVSELPSIFEGGQFPGTRSYGFDLQFKF